MIDTQKFVRVNNRIRSSEVRLVDAEGRQCGVVSIAEALAMANEAQLDLVEVAPGVKPPVCKIMDYSKYKYEQARREREAKKKQHVVHVKEIKMSSKIAEHDYQTKLCHLRKFLERKDRTKVTMFFRGREMTHMDIGREILKRLVQDLADVGEPEEAPKREGKLLLLNFRPK